MNCGSSTLSMEGIKLTAIASEIITTAAFVIVLFVVLFYQ